MGNAVKGIVDITVGEKTYKLQYSANGMCELESVAGCSAMKFLKTLQDNAKEDLSFGDVRLLFWAGLQEHHPQMTVRDAGKLITDMGGIAFAMQKAGEAVGLSMPDPQAAEGGAGKGKGAA